MDVISEDSVIHILYICGLGLGRYVHINNLGLGDTVYSVDLSEHHM